jgi:hypothetical protein
MPDFVTFHSYFMHDAEKFKDREKEVVCSKTNWEYRRQKLANPEFTTCVTSAVRHCYV